MKKYFSWVMAATLICGASLVTSCSDDDDDKEKEEKKEEGNVSGLLACPDNEHPHAIDLGLPSGTKWACCNVGASSPEQYGDYFAWGEIQPKSKYGWDNYAYWHDDNEDEVVDNNELTNIGSDIAGTDYDAATANWGSPWCMPTLEQIRELWDNCSYTWTSKNEIDGCEFTGSNGGKIFLPAAGDSWYGNLLNEGSRGFYWVSTQPETQQKSTYSLYSTSEGVSWGNHDRSYGQPVRPVRKN